MARRFNKTDKDYLYAQDSSWGTPVVGFPRSLSIWFRVSTASGVTEIYSHNVGADNQWSRIYLVGTTCYLSHKGYDNPTPLSVNLGAITLNTWHHVFAYFGSTTTFRGRLDGGTLVNNGGYSGSYNAYTEMNVGNRFFGEIGMDGDIGELAVWNLDLPNDIQILLSKGQTAFKIYPANLKAFYNMQSGFEGAGGYEHNLAMDGDSFHYLNPTTETNIDKVGGPPVVTTPIVGIPIPIVSASALVISPTGIASAETFGTPSIELHLEPSSIISAEAFGSFDLDLQMTMTGIPSAEVFGNIYITQGQTLVVIGIPSEEAFGDSSVNRGSVNLTLFSIPSEEAFGSFDIIRAPQFISMTGIPTEEAFGIPVIDKVISPIGIPSEEAFGVFGLQAGNIEVPIASIVSEESFGSFTVSPGFTEIQMEGIQSEESFGTPTLLTGNIDVVAGGILSEEAFGSFVVAPLATDIPISSIQAGETFGVFGVDRGNVDIAPLGIPSEEAFGDVTLLQGNIFILGQGIPSAEVFGLPIVNPQPVDISLSGMPSEEAFGQTSVGVGAVNLSVTGIGSAEAFGDLWISYNIAPLGIPSEEAFGAPAIDTGAVNLTFTGIDSEEAFGSSIVRHVLILDFDTLGIPSQETFGNFFVLPFVPNEFQALMDEDLDDIFDEEDEFSESGIVIHSRSGLTYAIPVILDNEYVEQRNDASVPVISRQPMITCKDRFREKPTRGDKYIFRGTNYQILTYEPDGTGVAILMLQKEKTNV